MDFVEDKYCRFYPLSLTILAPPPFSRYIFPSMLLSTERKVLGNPAYPTYIFHNPWLLFS